MNKILVEVSVGELLDKISILEIKKKKIKSVDKLNLINNEYNILKDQFEKSVKSDAKVNELLQSLKKINEKLWEIEDDKRMCEKKSDFGEKFIKLSRDVIYRTKIQFSNKYVSKQNPDITLGQANINRRIITDVGKATNKIPNVKQGLYDFIDQTK